MSTYKLSTPVTFNGKTFDELTFRKMKVKDACVADHVTGQTSKGLAILASIADVPLPVIMDMDIDDLEGAQEAALPFMGKAAMAATETAAS